MTNIVLPNGKVIKINIFEIMVLGILIFVSLSAGTQWGYGYRGQAMNLLCAVCVSALVVKKKYILNIETFVCMVLVTYIFINANCSINKGTSLQWAIHIFAMLLVIVYGINTDFWIKYERVCFIWTIIIALSVIISAISPEFIVTFFGWVLGPNSDNATNFLKKASEGQYAGFAREIAEAAVLCNVGIAVCYSKLFIDKRIDKRNICVMIVTINYILWFWQMSNFL